MSTRFVYIPNRVIDTDGISDGASIYVYQTGTTTPISLYLDSAATIPTTNPYVVAAGAMIPPLYYTYSGNVRMKIVSSNGDIRDEDPYDPFPAGVSTTQLNDTVALVADRTALAALTGSARNHVKFLAESGREGLFKFDSSNNATNVTNDPNQGIYVAPASDTTGASGVWVRSDREIVNVFWFMSVAEVADVRAFTYSVNVTTALKRASAYIQYKGGGTLMFPRGGYLVGLQTQNGLALDGVTTVAWAPSEIITIKNCTKPVRLIGNGSVIKAADGLKMGSFDPATGLRFNPALPFFDFSYLGYPYRAMINLEGNSGGVSIDNFELDGNNTKMTLGGYWGDSHWQVEAHGIWSLNNGPVDIKNVYAHHQGTDGLVLHSTVATTEATAPTMGVINNVRSRYNGRQGCSVVQGKNLTFNSCDFSNTGQALNTVTSELVQTSPGAGIDLEPTPGIIRDVTFNDCTVIGNWQKGIAASSGDSRRVSFKRCKIEGPVITSRPQYSFDDCVLIGNIQSGLFLYDQYKATSTGVTLTIAGAGPTYTVTRAAGSYLTDGFLVGDIIQLQGALNANNLTKNLIITNLTATVATVRPVEGATMTAEGPIASCTVVTGYSAKDSINFTRCQFTYDVSMTESGTLVDGTQSQMPQAVWHRFKDCSFETGSINIPNFTTAFALGERSPLFQNCKFRTSSSAAVNLWGRWQGYNFIEHQGTPSLTLGTNSRIESGNIYVNGTGQASATLLPDGDYGDVRVSGTGSTMKVESITLASANFPVVANAASDLNININGISGKFKGLYFNVSGGFSRWFLGDDGVAESGSNAGADFNLVRYNDAGSFLGYVMTATRSTGNVTFNNNVTAGNLSTAGSMTGTGSVSAITSTGTGGIGYATGAGGTVTQITSRTTGVTLNKICGSITLVSAAGSTSYQTFTVTNSTVASTDTIRVCQKSGTDKYMTHVTAVGAGAFDITFATTGGTTTEQPVFSFSVIKGVTS